MCVQPNLQVIPQYEEIVLHYEKKWKKEEEFQCLNIIL
jgi:hypothetical protein